MYGRTKISNHCKEQVARGNIKDLKVAQLHIECGPLVEFEGRHTVKLKVRLRDRDGLSLMTVAKHEITPGETLTITGFENCLTIKLA